MTADDAAGFEDYWNGMQGPLHYPIGTHKAEARAAWIARGEREREQLRQQRE